MSLKYELSSDQGASLNASITVPNVLFTDCTGRCQIRSRPRPDSPVVASPAVTFPVVEVGTNGIIELALTADETLAIPISSTIASIDTPETYYYDVMVSDINNVVTKQIYGAVKVYPAVTR